MILPSAGGSYLINLITTVPFKTYQLVLCTLELSQYPSGKDYQPTHVTLPPEAPFPIGGNLFGAYSTGGLLILLLIEFKRIFIFIFKDKQIVLFIYNTIYMLLILHNSPNRTLLNVSLYMQD